MPEWRDSRALVTGAAGFVGANLVAGLQSQGAQVHALVRPGTDLWRLARLPADLTVHRCDLLDSTRLADTVAAIQPDVVFHAAADAGHPVTADERARALANTVTATASVCEALRATPSRLVCLGSYLEYGPATEPLSETHATAPKTFRGAAKLAATTLCQQFGRESGTPTVILRLFSVYGRMESRSRFIPTVMRALLMDEEVTLTPPGIRHDFVSVDDVVAACLLAAGREESFGHIINIGSGTQRTNEAVVDLAEQTAGRRARVSRKPYELRPVDTCNSIADISKARILLGWAPTRSLAEGLRSAYEWWSAELSDTRLLARVAE